MKSLLILIITIFPLFATSTKMEFGAITTNMFEDKKYVKVLSNILSKQLKEEIPDIEFQIILYDNSKKALEDYKSGKLKLLAVPPLEYFKDQNTYDIHSKKRWFHKINDTVFQKYYLLSNKDAHKPLENISKYKVYYLDGFQAPKVWLSSLIKTKQKNVLKKMTPEAKASTMLFKTFFDKKNLAIISESSYNVIVEINPQLKNRLKILKKSEPVFLNVITLINSNMSEKDFEAVEILTKETKLFVEKSGFSVNKKLYGHYTLSNNELEKTKRLFLNYLKNYN